MSNYYEVVIGTRNPHKVKKLSEAIAQPGIELIALPAHATTAPEIGNSLVEIARAKALYYSALFPKAYVICTDGGIEIPALKNWNPLNTRRFRGEDATDFERLDALLELMQHNQGEQRIMKWKEAIAIAFQGKCIIAEEVEGATGLMQESYNPKLYREGIWLCSLWQDPHTEKNFFEMSVDEQKKVEKSWSHIAEILSNFFRRLVTENA